MALLCCQHPSHTAQIITRLSETYTVTMTTKQPPSSTNKKQSSGYAGRKITPSLCYVTLRGGGKMEKAIGSKTAYSPSVWTYCNQKHSASVNPTPRAFSQFRKMRPGRHSLPRTARTSPLRPRSYLHPPGDLTGTRTNTYAHVATDRWYDLITASWQARLDSTAYRNVMG